MFLFINNIAMGVIEVKELTKVFTLNKKQRKDKKIASSKLIAVDHISFELHEGEIYGLLGPNGAGKTTTLRMLATLLTPTSGSINIYQKDIVKQPSEARRMIGFLTSDLKLDNFFTPSYTFDFFADLYGLTNDEKESRKQFLFSKFGIDEFKYKKIGELSTGMKQKVSLAISLVHDPKVVIFDEPTNGLDIIASKLVEDYLIDMKKQNKTIIISTHILSLVEKLCDRIGIIIDGKLMFEDSKSNINDLEKTFFDLYQNVHGEND